MKRTLSFLMAVCMVAALCGTLYVSAEGNTPSVNITGVTAPVAGQESTVEGIVCDVPGVTVEASWGEYEYANGQITMPAAGESLTFEAGKIYRLELLLTATQPIFGYDVTYTVNGVENDEVSVYDETQVLILVDYVTEGVTVLDTLNITGIGNTDIGSVMTTANLQAEGAVIYSATWSFDGDYQDGVSVFEDGVNYVLDVYARPAEGYAFGEDMVITFEGAPYDTLWNQDLFNMNAGKEVRYGRETLGSVGISQLPWEITAGAAPTWDISVQDGYATVKDAYWVAADKTTKVTTLEDGKVYFLAVELEADAGYAITEETSIYAGWWELYASYKAINGKDCTAYFRYSLLKAVETVDITISGLEVGKKVSDVDVTVSGVEAEVRTPVIVNVNTYEALEDGVFEDGNAYLVQFTLTSDGTYEFTYDAKVTINGKENYYYGVDGANLFADYYLSFQKKIDKVELTVAEPAIGAKPGEVKAPEGANYTVNYYWTDKTDWAEMGDQETFKDGHRYEVQIEVVAKEGYDLAEDVKVTINGAEQKDFYLDDYCEYLDMNTDWTFADPIDKIELPQMPESIVVGGTPTQFDPVDTDKYTIALDWSDITTGEDVTTFADGRIYVLAYMVWAKEGYEITKDTKIYMGGKEYKGMWQYDYTDGYAMKTYVLGIDVIDRVDLTFTEPALGEKPGKVTTPKDAKYELSYYEWAQNKTGDIFDDVEEIDTFTVGNYNYLAFSLMADEGYAFDETTKFFVNGVEVEPAVCWIMGNENSIALRFEPLTENIPGGGTDEGGPSTNAPTGDTFPMAAVIVLMVLAVAGAAVVVSGKHKFAK